MTPRPPVALTIAGSDPSGGAGIQADLACFLALGVHGASAITALTAQSPRSISGVQEVPPSFVGEQIRGVCGDLEVGAAKTGMLAGAETVLAVADAVAGCGLRNLVVDPVMVSSSGTRLLAPEAVGVLLAALLPLAVIVTPNLAEAGALAGGEVRDLAGMRAAARDLHSRGPQWVLVKGGHLSGPAVDLLFDGDSFTELEAGRIGGPAGLPGLHGLHGTGCVLSAAITAHLARGASVPDAVAAAKDHVTGAIRHGLDFGAAGGCVDPAWNLRERAARPGAGSSRRARTTARRAGPAS